MDVSNPYWSAHQRWSNAGAEVRLNWKEVNIWRCRLDAPEDAWTPLVRYLSADELIRAGRFVFRKDRSRYIISHAFVRILLGRYAQRDPGSLRFKYGPNGRPDLELAESGSIGFNLSHAGDWAVCAVARSRFIGVDIECAPGNLDVSMLADACFSEGERRALAMLPQGQQLPSFLSCWTRKEAYLKSTASGLSIPLKSFEVSLRPSDPPKLLSIDGNKEHARGWFMDAFSPAEGYAGAVVVRGRGWKTRYLDFSFENSSSPLAVVDDSH